MNSEAQPLYTFVSYKTDEGETGFSAMHDETFEEVAFIEGIASQLKLSISVIGVLQGLSEEEISRLCVIHDNVKDITITSKQDLQALLGFSLSSSAQRFEFKSQVSRIAIQWLRNYPKSDHQLALLHLLFQAYEKTGDNEEAFNAKVQVILEGLPEKIISTLNMMFQSGLHFAISELSGKAENN